MTRSTPTLFDSLRRYWWIPLLLALTGAGIGVVLGLARDPVYTADAKLNVGRVDVATQSIPSFAVASRNLADIYARAIVAKPVVQEIREEAGLDREEVFDRVSASPIPESAVVQVFAEGNSNGKAVQLANLSSEALIAHVRSINRFNPDSKRLLEQFEDANEDLANAIVARNLAEPEDLAKAEAAVKTAKLRTEVAGGLYRTSQAGQASPNTLQVLAVASDSDSDETEYMQRAGFVGAVGGLLLGSLIALLLGHRRSRRRG